MTRGIRLSESSNPFCKECGRPRAIISKNGVRKGGTATLCPTCYGREYQRKQKIQSILDLGGVCVCCGESQIEFLTIDHINGKSNRIEASNVTHQKARREGFPRDKYRVLCYNCNCVRGFYGYCPHEGVPTKRPKREWARTDA